MTIVKIDVDGETYEPVAYDNVKIKQNGWVMCWDGDGMPKDATHYPPHEIMQVEGQVRYS